MRPEIQVSHVTEGKPISVNLDARGLKFAILRARFNAQITAQLYEGAMEALVQAGASPDSVELEEVPGSWELPVAAKTIATTNRCHAIIALGAVIRGDTPHFDFVAGETARGLMTVQVETGIPVAFGVLTTNTVEQAADRAGGKDGNKGYDAALVAIEMANLLRRLRK